MANIVSPNMGLIIPTVSNEPGPTYAVDINTSLGLLDVHDHSTSKGVPITPAGLNISSDLTFSGNSAINLKANKYLPQLSALSGVLNPAAVYVAGNELYYNDVAGNQVQITKTGNVNAGAGSITGLSAAPTASANYSSLSQTFVWQSGVNTAANLDAASYILRNQTANSYGLTLQPPTLTANYSVTLPPIPTQTNVVTIDTSGNLNSQTWDQVGQNMTSVGANAIAADRTRATGATVGIGGVAASLYASGAFTTTSTSPVTYVAKTVGGVPQSVQVQAQITSSGRPIFVGLNSPNGQASSITITSAGTNGSGSLGYLQIVRSDGSIVAGFQIGTALVNNSTTNSSGTGTITSNTTNSDTLTVLYPASQFSALDFSGAGTYTYSIQVNNQNSSGNTSQSLSISNVQIVAYEL